MFRIDFNKLRFLVCDDNPHMRRILRTLLHSFGAREVYEAEDGATALEMYSHYVPDIVITDWAMPIFDGLELAQMIRQPESKGNPYAPIIMLTGHSEKRRVTVARDAGVTEFLAKPISAKEPLSAHPQRGRQSPPLHQDQDLFRPGPAPQHQLRLYGPRAPRRRKARGAAAALAARQGPLLHLARTSSRTRQASWRRTAQGTSRSRPSPTHHVITQPNPLRKVLRRVEDKDMDDPVGRAEQALAGLSGEFKDWMATEVDAAVGRLCRHPATTASPRRRATSCSAPRSDIKGDAATFGYPSAAAHRREPVPRHRARAGSGERCRPSCSRTTSTPSSPSCARTPGSTAISVSAELSRRLRKVADEYLAHVNRDRPEHLEAILAPSIVPAE